MKGFIEVTETTGNKTLINVNWIEHIEGGNGQACIYMAFNMPYATEQDYIFCVETYEEVKAMIEKAVGE